MRSSRSGRSKRADPSQFPTAWSEWEWSDQFKCYQRYRLKGPEDYEWDYGQVQSSALPRTQPSPDLSQPLSNDYPEQTESNYTTAPSIEGITQRIAQTTLGPSPSSVQQPTFGAPWTTPNNYIKTRDLSTDREAFDPHYKVHGAWEFKWGRVFKVLWTEPKGEGGPGSGSGGSGTESIRKGKHGDEYHAKVRRFVIISPHEGHCICLPIMTYSGQGVKKRGVHANHHTIIYTDKPIMAKGEKEKGLTKKPIKIIPSSPRHKLDKYSRLNYAKTYTVEYNVKVWFIGKVDKDSEWQLKTDYNRIHPPLDTRGIPSSFTEDAIYEETAGGTTEPASGYTYGANTYQGGAPGFGGSSQGGLFPAGGYQQGGSSQYTMNLHGGTSSFTADAIYEDTAGEGVDDAAASQHNTYNAGSSSLPARGAYLPGAGNSQGYQMGRSTSQQDRSGNLFYPSSQQSTAQPSYLAPSGRHNSYSGASYHSGGGTIDSGNHESDQYRRGSVHDSEHHSDYGPLEAREQAHEVEGEGETETETEDHFSPEESGDHGGLEEDEDIYEE